MAPPRAGSATLRWTAMFLATVASLALVALGVNLGSGMLGLRDQRAALDAAPATAAVVDVGPGAPAPGLLAADAGSSPSRPTNIAAAFFTGLAPADQGPASPGPGAPTDDGAPAPSPVPGPVAPPEPPSEPSLGPVLAPLAPILEPLPIGGDAASSEATEPSGIALIDQLADAIGL